MNTLNFKSVKSICSLILVLIFILLFTGCQSQSDVRSDTLLDNFVSKENDGFVFEQIPWKMTKKELIDNGHIPSKGVTDDGNGFLILDDKITFKEPRVDATARYLFHEDMFFGGDYIIQPDSQDELVRVATELRNLLIKELGEPENGPLKILSEESIRNGSQEGMMQYISEDYTSLDITVYQSPGHPKSDFMIQLSTRYADGPLPDLLK